MNALATIVLSWLLLIAAFVVRPPRATCPRGTYVQAVKVDGSYACHAVAPIRPREERAPWPVEADDSEDIELHGAVYCTGGQRAIAGNDGRTVGCQRNGWSP